MTGSPRVSAPSQVTHIVEAIRDGLRWGRYSPGQRLIEADLTRMFDVSRGPVREALGRLQVEGLVEITPHRGASVRQMTSRDVEELMVVRQMLEGQAARLAALNIDQSDNRENLKRATRELKQWTRTKDVVGYVEANDAVHGLILEVAGNRLLTKMVRELRQHAFRLLFADILSVQHVRQSALDNVQLLQAILEGDATKAESVMRRQLQRTADEALTLIQARSVAGRRRAGPA
jgi:DNA-binding GntR family transcriptional regulator